MDPRVRPRLLLVAGVFGGLAGLAYSGGYFPGLGAGEPWRSIAFFVSVLVVTWVAVRRPAPG